MNEQSMMKHLVEQEPDGCWHEWEEKPAMVCGVLRQCTHCSEVAENHQPYLANPTLTLDWLFEVAEKLGITTITSILPPHNDCAVAITYQGTIRRYEGSTPQLALLSALCKATGYESEEV